MTQTRNELATQIRNLLRQMESLVADETTGETGVGAAPIRTPEEAKQMAASGLCLDCGKPIPANNQKRRGLHQACYQRAKRLLDQKEITDAELVAAGLMLPAETGGRPTSEARSSSSLEQFIKNRAIARGNHLGDTAPIDPPKKKTTKK